MYNFPDPKTTDLKERRIQRFFEILPGVMTWSTFILFVVVSSLYPVGVSIFILLFDLYWIIVAIYLSFHLIFAYRSMKHNMKIDWLPIVQQEKGFDDIYHVVLFPTYDESKELLGDSLQAIQDSSYPNHKLMVVVATEAREGDPRDQKEAYLKKRFKGVFDELLFTIHPDNIVGELKGKGSNLTYAAQEVKSVIDAKKIAYENILISVFDSDTITHAQYFAILTSTFLNQPNRLNCSYQPLPLYNNNIWDTPAFIRVVAISSSFWHMMESMRPERMVTFSSHSMSFKTLVDVNYWPVNMVSDDSVIYWKCFDYHNGNYKTVPIHIPVSLDAVLADTVWQTFKNQYKQKRRWAYGIENLPTTVRSVGRNPKIHPWVKLNKIGEMLLGHYAWATASFVIAVFGWFPILFGGREFRQTILSHNLPIYTRGLLTLSVLGIVVTAYISIVLLPDRPKKYSRFRTVAMYLQWMIVPFVSILLGSLPAIDAQTRLMFGKYLGFWVTPKIRKED